MTETPDSHGHHGPTVQTYLVIGVALGGFTIASFVVNGLYTAGFITAVMGFFIILGVAVVKALLVAAYFMHLKYDWAKVGFMIIPALILGTMMMLVLLPDTVLAWGKVPAGESDAVAPSPLDQEPGPQGAGGQK
jgi:caa(3)-type oxidase subunit IV